MIRPPAGRAGLRGPITATLLAAALGAAAAAEVVAQTVYGTPEVGTSELRGPAIGARLGIEVVGGMDVVGQALLFFPDEEGVADPGVGVRRSLWHGSLNVLYVFDRSRGLAPYVGAGVRYGRASLSVVVDGLRARDVRGGFSPNVLGGARLPRLPGHPFVEYRSGGGGGWVLTAGAHLALRSG